MRNIANAPGSGWLSNKKRAAVRQLAQQVLEDLAELTPRALTAP